jgi:hypothetical protein
MAVHEELDAREARRRRDADENRVGDEAAAEAAAAAAARGAPVVCMRHIERALARARPSLPAAERARLDGVYGRFMAGRDPGLAGRRALAEAKGKGKRATLA